MRNLVGIAGKPHPSTIIAVIGPATAKTAEEHGLRVDVLAPEPTAQALVDALTGGRPQIFNGSVPFLLFVPNTTTASNVSGVYTETQG